ncbi:hypothetical protein [Dermatophilus congolensis]|uniref:hypothetical protein n=1 Tax=Dermatophilus congolensis TaxID=1863 RepID=UPI001AAE9EE6|nr:hypothetical protein [Dermatophilus congolensis]MBO3129850.1 hypothetical protein [Dermatophilus congolensis]MBO3131522.1 hypothetical protein [Dermatophilus congolensis]MBO3134325.1 hypothetical protein [Dermatophilus congolensis]MBO3136559.1 hypothetical protein [Dermatophilus congolensis]MBO3138803.1 hypothetical protein [Dermatophilus congolensis]
MQGANQSISAGLGGFFALFLMSVALWVLMRSMLKHLRNADHAVFEEDTQQSAITVTTKTSADTDGNGSDMAAEQSQPSNDGRSR